jgi:hypothetical protein
MTTKVSGASSSAPSVSNEPTKGTELVHEGESNLNEVAKRLGVSGQALRDANPQIKGNKVQAGQELKLPEKQSSKSQSKTQDSAPQAKRRSSDSSSSRTAEMKLAGRYVEASLRNHVETSGGSAKPADASSLNGMRLGWLKDGSEVKISRDLSPAGGHETRMEAIAYARLTGANPAAVVKDCEGKWHAVQTDKNFYGGFRASSDNPLQQVEGLAHFDKGELKQLQDKIDEASKKGDTDEVARLRKTQAALIFGVQDSEINFIRNSSDRVAGKININAGQAGGGMHGAERAPNSNFDPTKKNAMEISLQELGDPNNAPGIIFHENSHAKDYALTQHWVKQYETETGSKFIPGDKGDPAFTLWVNKQAPKRLSRADAELVSDVSANANGSSEAKAYVGTFINALKAGNPDAAAAQLKTYAEGMLSRPHQKINRPTGGNVEMELKRQLETEYRKMPQEMKKQFDAIFKELSESPKYSDAWISKFKHATAMGPR